MTTAQPRRRFFRYSLRTLFLVVTVFCIWLGIIANRARDQKHAVEVILEAGGHVMYEHQIIVLGMHHSRMLSPGTPSYSTEPPGPEWLRQVIGDEYFFRVHSVSLRESEVNSEVMGATLAMIGRLNDLRSVDLSDLQITDAGMVHLRELNNLRWLFLDDTNVNDAKLEHVKRLIKLEWLHLDSTEITDAGLVNLKGLVGLIGLSLSYTQITFAGMEHLYALTNLEEIHLYGTQITNEDAKIFQQALPNCEIRYTDENGLWIELLPTTSSHPPQK